MHFRLSFATVLIAVASLVKAAPTPFITPSIFTRYSNETFTVIDEWTLCQKLGKADCFKALKPHWDNFATLSDFKKVSKAGFNVVRIPIGYWAYLDIGEPYTIGAASYLDKAIGWARKVGLKVIIDLHGAPGSQNGFDHSGHKQANPGWGTYDSIPQTHRVLQILEEKYAVKAMQDVVIAIELLNEPYLSKLDPNMVKKFYKDGYDNIRAIGDTPMVMHDGFKDPVWLNNFLSPENGAYYVIVDHHEYQIFSSDTNALSPQEHRTLVCNSIDKYKNSDKWRIVGEWSAAMTDCAPHLNGFRSGNRYEGTYPESWRIGSCAGKTGKVKTWSQEWKDDVRKYIETQLDAYEKLTNGWVFWNFKTEDGAGEWDLFQLLDNGVFPQPLASRKFGKYCTNL